MSHFELRYTPTSDLGARFPSWVIAVFRTRETAEAVVPTCPNAEQIEVVESGESSTLQGDSRREPWDNRGGPNRAVDATLPGPDHLIGTSERG